MNLLTWLFPPKCPYCRVLISHRETECASCRSQFPRHPLFRQIPSGEFCLAPFRYEGKAKTALLRLKFYDCCFNAQSLARQMAHQLQRTKPLPAFDIVTCIPLSKRSRRERGYNQSEELAVPIAKALSLPYERLLRKVRNNRKQHELNAEERAVNIRNVYAADERVQGKTILLIDDICTTGHTLSEACRVLKKAGAKEIFCCTAAIAGTQDIT